MKKERTRILVVAMSPPPYGGQAMMVQTMLGSSFKHVQLYHVRMAFSSSMRSIGRFEINKVFHMFMVVFMAIVKSLKYQTNTLYYVPGGSGVVPVVRDIFILFFLRMIPGKVIFHFHAAGVSEVVERLPVPLRGVAKKLYSRPDLAIFLSKRNPDNQYFNPKQSTVIPNGLADKAGEFLAGRRKGSEVVSILFVGVVQESKGVMTLLEAASVLIGKGHRIQVTIMGEFSTNEFEQKAEQYCVEHQLKDIVIFTGVLTGHHKWEKYAGADIFCFPSWFESESFGNVVVEAMMFEMPVVATDWRGIPDIVEDGHTGFLIPIKNSIALAEKLEILIGDEALRHRMGRNGRAKYLSNYTLDRFVGRLQTAFNTMSSP